MAPNVSDGTSAVGTFGPPSTAKLIRCVGGLDCSQGYHRLWLPDCRANRIEANVSSWHKATCWWREQCLLSGEKGGNLCSL
jgi:hypothetical protein